jgi:hypothetical protein
MALVVAHPLARATVAGNTVAGLTLPLKRGGKLQRCSRQSEGWPDAIGCEDDLTKPDIVDAIAPFTKRPRHSLSHDGAASAVGDGGAR